MCGITGFVDYNKSLTNEDALNMIKKLNHRGPDHFEVNFYEYENYNISFAHARLSIIDLSSNANQPLVYKHLKLVFNGEIYNYQEIKRDLIQKGHIFSTHSDTEVVIHAFEEWSIQCVDKFIGMFAFAIHDELSQKVYIFKDRAGIKPLYYSNYGNRFLFASELKSLLELNDFKRDINENALLCFFQQSYIPAPYSIYKYANKLDGGQFIIFDLLTNKLQIQTYWNVFDFFDKSKKTSDDYETAKEKINTLFVSATKYRMISDVPIGVFLSGGYDSSLIASLLTKEVNEKIKTFTIGFDIGNNEAPFAKEIAQHLNTEHFEYYMKVDDAKSIINDLAYYFDEPFGDSSVIPTTFISKKASEKVKVVLSADGGDELFFGYNHFELYKQYANQIHKIPEPFTKITSILLFVYSLFYSKRGFKYRKLRLLSEILKSKKTNRHSILFNNLFQISSPYLLNSILNIKNDFIKEPLLNAELFENESDEFMALAYKNYLQYDILKKVDIATMSASIEGREPLMDHRLLEYAASLPLNYKYDGRTKKRILKDIMYEKYLPKRLMDRPKTGFTVPIYDWLKTDLSYLFEDFCSIEKLNQSGYLNANACKEYINQFLSNQQVDETVVWKILTFQMWYFKWIKQ